MNTPLLDFYEKRNLLYTVDGNQEIDDVFAAVKKVLDTIKD